MLEIFQKMDYQNIINSYIQSLKKGSSDTLGNFVQEYFDLEGQNSDKVELELYNEIFSSDFYDLLYDKSQRHSSGIIAWFELSPEASGALKKFDTLQEYCDSLVEPKPIQKEIVVFQKADASNPLLDLHPTVQSVASNLFEQGHFRQAILDTYIALVEAVKAKSGINLDNSPLMQKVFSQNSPILKVSNNSDEQLGFMWLFSGAVMGIRNPKAHKLIQQKDPQRAFEWLAFASVLFRVLDDSQNV